MPLSVANTIQYEGAQTFQKSRSHLKILRARWMTGLVTPVTWDPQVVHL